jgi:hypothetical protein
VNNGPSRASYDTDNILWKFPKPVDVSATKLHRSCLDGQVLRTRSTRLSRAALSADQHG